LPQNTKLLANEIAFFRILNVPLFKQTNPTWGSLEYDAGTSQMLFCGTTISQCGCATTSVAMMLTFYGVIHGPDGNPTNPATVDNYFKLDQTCGEAGCVSRGYSYGNVIWNAAAQYSEDANELFGTPIIAWNGFADHDPQTIRNDIINNRPVILEIDDPDHFIVASGIAGDTFTINDPGFSRTRLDDPAYNNTSLGLRRFRETGTDLSSIVVVALAPTQILITDQNGNQTGFDSSISEVVEDIPNSSYFFDQAYIDVTGQNPPPPAGAGVHMAIVSTPQAGTFEVEVIEAAGKLYSFAVYAYDSDADLGLNLFERQPALGVQDHYIFTYDPIPGATTLALVTPIDIKPGSDPNSINPRSKGVIPIAILTTDTFDATTVDPLTLLFAPNNAVEAHGQGHVEDADGDGDLDLMLHFNTQDTGIACGDTEASLSGATFDGTLITGSDSIVTVGCN
jgi:hypothetical protein